MCKLFCELVDMIVVNSLCSNNEDEDGNAQKIDEKKRNETKRKNELPTFITYLPKLTCQHFTIRENQTKKKTVCN